RVLLGSSGALRLRLQAARRARLPRQVSGSDSLRQGQLSARRVPVLLARVRDHRRVLRLLPRLPRVLEAVRHRITRSGAAKALQWKRAEARPGAAAGTIRKAWRAVARWRAQLSL